jgi:hypothetical protein
MGYYGDFYRRPYGDYYRGDPGFLSFLGKGLQAVGGFIPGVGGLVSSLGAGLAKSGEKKALPAAAGIASTAIETAKSGALRAGQTLKAHPVLTAAGAAGLGGIASGVAGVATGKLLARRAAAAGGRRHRRMRVTNPKALRRAIRRTQGFAKLAMRTIHLVHPKRKVRFGGFRKRKKSR